MNIIQQQREDIIRNNNNAQENLEQILKTITNATNELKISIPLHGDLNLQLLKEEYAHINTLIFTKGEITSLQNVPNTLQTLVVQENLLTELKDLPDTILHLDIHHNYLTELNVSHLKNLESLDCNNNRLETLDLPAKIKSLNCSHNDIKTLDSTQMQNLHTLNISHNPVIVINNMDSLDISVFEHENTPLLYIGSNDVNIQYKDLENAMEDSMAGKQVDYLMALKKYMKLKADYESKNRSERRKLFYKNEEASKQQRKYNTKSYQPKCVKCGKPGGSIFSTQNNVFSVMCGSKTDPCSLKIKLFRSEHLKHEDIMNAMKVFVDGHKEDIIKHKLDALFAFESESTVAKKSKATIEQYNEDNALYTKYMKIRNELYFNEEHKEKIRKKTENIYEIQRNIRKMLDEYLGTNEKKTLDTAMTVYISDLIPERQGLQRLRFDVHEMDIEKGNNNTDPSVSILRQYEVDPRKTVTHYGEAPVVQKYVI